MSAGFENSVREALIVDVPAGARESCRARVMARAEEIMAERPRTAAPVKVHRPRRSLLLRPVALAAALMTPFFAGTALAANGAAPDSFLYPIKEGMESAREIIALSATDRARVQLDHADNRLDETEQMLVEEKYEYVPDLLVRYQRHMDSATVQIDKALAAGDDVSGVERMAEAARDRYESVLASWNNKSGAARIPAMVAQSSAAWLKAVDPQESGAGSEVERAAPALVSDGWNGGSTGYQPHPAAGEDEDASEWKDASKEIDAPEDEDREGWDDEQSRSEEYSDDDKYREGHSGAEPAYSADRDSEHDRESESADSSMASYDAAGFPADPPGL